MKACIVIPLYQKISNTCEILSLKQGLKVFKNYPVVFLCPQSLNESYFDQYLSLHPNIVFVKFPDYNFTNTTSYNLMLLDSEFYKKFANYEFMLIYQTDAYVFNDELEYWCNTGLDYIGAPWFENFTLSDENCQFLPFAGNGGFSLRRVSKINHLMQTNLNFSQMRKCFKLMRLTKLTPHTRLKFYLKFLTQLLCRKNSFGEVCNYIKNNYPCVNEDYFFAYIFPKFFSEFKSANFNQAIAFAFECQPEKLYKLNGNKLPFGCHAWQKYSPQFWQKFINFDVSSQ